MEAQASESAVIICARRKPEEGGFPCFTLMTWHKYDLTQIARDVRLPSTKIHRPAFLNHRDESGLHQRAPVPHLIRGYVDSKFS